MSKYTFFYSATSPFSNWYQKSGFTYEGVRYNCSEQYMMHMKALMFDDTEVADLIMVTFSPYKQKQLGREVRNFDKAHWDLHCEEIMVPGLVAKFTQDEFCKATMLATGKTILVEASPTDTIWGVGLAESDPRILDETQWRGLNRLGNVLMVTREIIEQL